MKYMDKVYQENCIFILQDGNRYGNASIVAGSLQELKDMYCLAISEKGVDYRKEKTNYLEIEIYNSNNFCFELSTSSKRIQEPFKEYLSKHAYKRLLWTDPKMETVYMEIFCMVNSKEFHFPSFSHDNFHYDYEFLYGDYDISSIKEGQKFRTNFFKDNDKRKFTVMRVNSYKLTLDDTPSIDIAGIYCEQLNKNGGILRSYGAFNPGIPLATMKFID